MPGSDRGQALGRGPRPAARHLLLLREERLELGLLLEEAEARLLDDLLLEDEAFGPLFALARSLCALLFCELALPPMLAACARLILPEEDEDDAEGLEDEEEEDFEAEGLDDDDEEDFEAEGLDEDDDDFDAEGFDEDEEEELRDAMACSFGW